MSQNLSSAAVVTGTLRVKGGILPEYADFLSHSILYVHFPFQFIFDCLLTISTNFSLLGIIIDQNIPHETLGLEFSS